MAELKKLWICYAPTKIDGSFEHLFGDPSITKIQDEEHRIAQIGPSPEGMTVHAFVRVYMGTGQDRWEKEKTKVYDDYASAKKDAEGRLAKAKKQYEAEKKAKTAAKDPLVLKVANRFKGTKQVRSVY